jgi:mono/diheme cytochrome c family protein
VNVRSIIAASLAALAAAGCGAPAPDKFADGKVTKQLHNEAAAVVRDTVTDHFGTPQNLVTTLELSEGKQPAIDFGVISGVVVDSNAVENAETLREHQFYASLSGDQSVTRGEIKGLAVVWKSGDYVTAVIEAPKADPKREIKKGQEVDASFHVLDFKPAGDGVGLVSLNFKLESPVKPGDKFEIIGHRLRKGRSLYMRHCMHCHGASGDGNGPTAKYLNPLPRDYRRGLFKFTSTRRPDKPSREDLKRIVQKGIPGTYMPAFLPALEERELDDIIEYVRWLSMRGEMEHNLGVALAAEGFSKSGWEKLQKAAAESDDPEAAGPKKRLENYVKLDLPQAVNGSLTALKRNWELAEDSKSVIMPSTKRIGPDDPDYQKSLARGRELFLSTKANCFACHGTTGRGNGPQTTSFQKNTMPLAPAPEYPEPGLFDDWGNRIQPRDLTRGIYRGGRRPIDLYWRVKNGIKGTPMPTSPLPDEQIWDIVNYVLSLPYQENGTLVVAKVR